MTPWTSADRGAQSHTAGVSHHQPMTRTALGWVNNIFKGLHLKLEMILPVLNITSRSNWSVGCHNPTGDIPVTGIKDFTVYAIRGGPTAIVMLHHCLCRRAGLPGGVCM